jgi:CPA2 family monovalent cation:H+ antiporter-2
MHNLDLIATLAGGFIAALALGLLAHRLGWSPIVGYLMAGILVGPHTPGFVANKHMAEQLSEVGVILLMFGVGLHFHLKDLAAVRGIAIIGALTQSAVATALGAAVVHAFGWNWAQGLVFGLVLSVASTVVLVRVLSANGELQSPIGRIAIGWLVVEDIFTVFVLVLLPVLFSGKGGSLPLAIGVASLKLIVFIGLTLATGAWIVPKLLKKVADTHSRELFTLSVLAIALGIAVGAAYWFDVSMALGAFLAGMVVGQTEFSERAGSDALPLRDAFAVMFFVSVGMLFEPRQALDEPLLILATLAVVLIAKPLAAFGIVAMLGYSSAIGLGVALALAQIGEFSFLLVTLGRQSGALPESAMNPVVAASILSIMLNPMLYHWAKPMEAFLAKRPRPWRMLNRKAVPVRQSQVEMTAAHRAVIVGYGPIGRMVSRILEQRGIAPTIIEMNRETHAKLLAEGRASVGGAANQRSVLEAAGIEGASSLIFSASGTTGALEAVRAARELNPEIHVIARADYIHETSSLRAAGASDVFSGEGEVALAIADSILRHAGATPDQLDEAREQIRKRLQER